MGIKKRGERLRKLNSDDSRDLALIFANRSRQHRSETGRRRSLERTMCLDLPDPADLIANQLQQQQSSSPPSDQYLYDNFCYATTPSSSNENSDAGGGGGGYCVSSDEGVGTYPAGRGSPTSKLLLEYEMHLRNALARGLDAESYSLHTFEALLSQSMENVGEYKTYEPYNTLKQHRTLFSRKRRKGGGGGVDQRIPGCGWTEM